MPFRAGVLINVPNPARFALHKLVVSCHRPAAQHAKVGKDIQQASELLSGLLDDRPGDVWLELDAVQAMPKKFASLLLQGVKQLPPAIREAMAPLTAPR